MLVSLSIFMSRKASVGKWLPSHDAAPAKRACEIWFLGYGVFWILCFGVIIALRLYDDWGHLGYFVVLGGLMSPLLVQPLLFPSLTCDQGKPLIERYSFKANVWMLVFGFIGNYWYTHYFYTVLQASYTMQSWDLNGVPIPMFFATHFYFCFYHTLSNMALRKVCFICTCMLACIDILCTSRVFCVFVAGTSVILVPAHCFPLTHAPVNPLPAHSCTRKGCHNIQGRLGAVLLHHRAGSSLCHLSTMSAGVSKLAIHGDSSCEMEYMGCGDTRVCRQREQGEKEMQRALCVCILALMRYSHV